MSEDYRADVGDVRKYLHREDFDTTGLQDSQIKAYIDDANLIVDEDLEGTGQSERRLKKIEALLTGAIMLESAIDGLRQKIEDDTDRQRSRYAEPEDVEGWHATSLGRLAIRTDKSGKLAEAHKPTASISVPASKQSARSRPSGRGRYP